MSFALFVLGAQVGFISESHHYLKGEEGKMNNNFNITQIKI